MEELMKLKQNIESLIKLSEESWQKISDSFSLKYYKKGEILLCEGQICPFVAYNIDGLFREYFYHNGIDKTSDFIIEDTFFSAYTSFVNQAPSKVYIEALTDSKVLYMDYFIKKTLFNTVPEWDRLARLITEKHYTDKENRANTLSSLTAREKYLDLLKNGNPKIIKNIPLQYIASYLGITPETLSRIRKKL